MENTKHDITQQKEPMQKTLILFFHRTDSDKID